MCGLCDSYDQPDDVPDGHVLARAATDDKRSFVDAVETCACAARRTSRARCAVASTAARGTCLTSERSATTRWSAKFTPRFERQ